MTALTEPNTEIKPFLGVETSLGGRRWMLREADERLALALAQRLGVPEVLSRMLAARNVDPTEVKEFLSPSLRSSLPNPSLFKDMDQAAERLLRAIKAGEGIAVFGDYDVDGATSAALLYRFLDHLGAAPLLYVPDRVVEGYGPNAPALLGLQERGAAIVITVDCGVAAHTALQAAADAGLEVIVVDHHAAEAQLPPAAAVVNPNRLDETAGHGQLAAVGVTFLLVVALNRALRQAGWYKAQGLAEPDLLAWLDLVALGTVCDVVPLTGVNRALVSQGLKVMARRGNTGLAALSEVARIDRAPNSYHAGYLLGPRINAGGRVGQADLGVRLLTTGDPTKAASLAQRLDELNAERRAIEQTVLDAAIAQVEARREGVGSELPALLMVAGEGWHQGVIGIVAGRLKDRYHRPSLVIALEEGLGKGSARSLPGIDFGAQVLAARQAGLLLAGGGHAMAAGLSVKEEVLPALEIFLEERIGPLMAARDPRPCLTLDGAITPRAANAELCHLIEQVGPFGAGNSEPRFAIPAARVLRASVVGDAHVRCIIAGSEGTRLKAIAFRCLDSAWGQALLASAGRPLHLAGKLRRDDWAGAETVQFILDDAAHP